MKAVKLKLECPGCDNIINKTCPILANSKGFQIHSGDTQCGCGRRSNFKILNLSIQEMYEVKNGKKSK